MKSVTSPKNRSRPYKKNEFGFYEITNKPSEEELGRYYKKKYYQNNQGTYRKKYSSDELDYIFNCIKLKHFLLKGELARKSKHALLDVGCGEGFALRYFDELGWDVLGLDFSNYGCKTHNPKYLNKVIVGDIYDTLEAAKDNGRRFEVIWLDSVLEHVLNPLKLLKLCYDLGDKGSFLVVEVPNDFSAIQRKALEMGFANNEFWVVAPDHISYFNQRGLKNILKEAGWKLKAAMADFPIDFNLFNKESNYIKNPKKGPAAHRQRIEIEKILHSMPAKKATNFYKALGDLGMGRHIIAVAIKAR